MPTTVVTIGELKEGTKRQLAASIAGTFIKAGIPDRLITILFHHIGGDDLALGRGEFPYWPEGAARMPTAFARAEITSGSLDERKKSKIAAGIGDALINAGVPNELVTVVFRDVNGADVFSGRGASPFRPSEKP